MASTNGPANSSGFVIVTASNSQSPRVSSACSIASASTSSTSLPMSVSKMIFVGGSLDVEPDGAATDVNGRHSQQIRMTNDEWRRKSETRNPKPENALDMG